MIGPGISGADRFLGLAVLAAARRGAGQVDSLAMSPGRRLLDWYDRNRRDLPWRKSADPYAVWVSEIMLQQTRVETGRKFYARFLKRFPNAVALAEAPLAEVLAAWSGLGYYRRARELHAAARIVRDRGALPTTAAELEQLPGVGPYTAAAIASIAFGEAVPVLDGNVARLLSRWCAEEEPVAKAATRGRLLAIAASLLDRARPGDSNQALMELGATVCLPAAPDCARCPLASACRAYARGEQRRFPVRASRGTTRQVAQVAAVVESAGRLLLFRRADQEAQLAGLWELPLVDATSIRRASRELAARYGGEWTIGAAVGRVRHAITTRRFTIVARRATLGGAGNVVAESPVGAEPGWFARAQASTLALTGAARKILARLPG